MAAYGAKRPVTDELPFLLPPTQIFPRLGIIHFLAWITLTAALIGLWEFARLFDTPGGGSPGGERSLGEILFCADLVAVAAGFVAACSVLRAKSRDLFLDAEPGHWLAIVHSVLFVVAVAMFFAAVGLAEGWDELVWIIVCLYFILPLLFGVAWLILAYCFRDEPLWCMAFGLATTTLLGAAVMAALAWFDVARLPDPWDTALIFTGISITGAVVLIAALVDLAQRQWRDWAHWVGVSVTIAHPALIWASVLWGWW